MTNVPPNLAAARNAPLEPAVDWFMEGLVAGKAPTDTDAMPDE